ncbi:MAG: ribosome small subunit-dependent GTPase A [Deltaproteobacteria bacterium]|nr:ribosome small subunit-dependent GTPase A [Deltaproteobacteria bacterium]
MSNIPKNIKELGFDEWFQNQVDPEKKADFEIARVLAVHKDSYELSNGANMVFAELVGKMMFSAESSLALPTVGDWVLAHFYNNDTFAIIHETLPRKSLLKRKTSGKKIDFQLIAANIDTAFIMQSLDADFNLNRLERYMVMIHEANIQPIVLLSKSDLVIREEIEDKIGDIKKIMPQLQVIPFNNKNGDGLGDVKRSLKPGFTYCLLGSSGVGKTTLLNNLMGEPLFKTKTIREKDGKGRHATTSRQLIILDNGAMIIDTPGMRELGNMAVDSGLADTFHEITLLAEQCRYSDCRHINEAGCAVLAALEDGTISEKRYRNYIKMKKESDYYEMSYHEKRKKDKAFGRLVKSVMKHKKG